MRVSARTLAVAAIALLVVCRPGRAAEVLLGTVRIEVTDSSGGVLPGVTVTAAAPDGEVIITTVTDQNGGARLEALPPGAMTLTFQLDGFDRAVAAVAVRPTVETDVVQRLALAPIAETVMVVAPAPVDSPPLPLIPAPVLAPVPVHDQDAVCGPAKASNTLETLGTVRSRRWAGGRRLYAPGDELLLEGGTLTGLAIGQNVLVRRLYHVTADGSTAMTGEHTSGLLQIVEADERSAVAVIIYACDEIMKGDFLASFTPPPPSYAEPQGLSVYSEGDAARVLFADAGQTLGVPRRLMVIDRGSSRGIRPGQRLTLFHRQARGREAPEIVGDAIVVAVRSDSATIRVERAIDAIEPGDWAAPQRPAARHTRSTPD